MKMILLFTTLVAIYIFSCGVNTDNVVGTSSGGSTTDPTPTPEPTPTPVPVVPNGVYTLDALKCASSGTAITPLLDAAAILLYDFKNTTSRFFIVNGAKIQKVTVDSNCTMVLTGVISRNENINIDFSKEKEHSWSSACTLTLNTAGSTEVGTSSFIDDTDTTTESSWIVSIVGNSYTLHSLEADYSAVGCTANDQLVTELTLQ